MSFACKLVRQGQNLYFSPHYGSEIAQSLNGNARFGFDDFRVLRAIGRGAFGKVCIVEKKDSKQMYAMKYMSKLACIEKDAVRNVLREMDILMGLDHSFLVNLWFTFQDEEDLFVVVDLLLGGDFRYHLHQGIKFSEDVVRIYVGEIAMALEYLRSHRIIHRDIKPDNLLLDTKGHVHLTDFNVATVMEDENTLATSMSGTKPYMAPEIFKTSLGKLRGYSYEVDWWSLGISVFEILRGKRPYHISSNTNLVDIIQLFESTCLMFPSSWSKDFKSLIRQLLHIDPKIRLNSVEKLKECELMHSVNWDSLCKKEIILPFIPSKDHLNCDPTYELEEMIIEPNPLHKKKKRLAKQNSNKVCTGTVGLTPMQMKLDSLGKKFKPYNREREKISEQQREKNKFNDEKIPEVDESFGVVELENEVQLNGKTHPNEIEDIKDKEESVKDVLKVEDAQQDEKVVIAIEVEKNSFPSDTEKMVEIPEQGKGLPNETERSFEIAERRKDLLNEKERLIVAEKRKSYPTNNKESSIEVVLQRKSFPNEKERPAEVDGKRKSFSNEKERSAELFGGRESLPNRKEKLIELAEKRKSYPGKDRESSTKIALRRKSFPNETEKSTEVAEASFPNDKERLIEKADQDMIKDTEQEERNKTGNAEERAELRDKESLLQNDKIDVKKDENRVTTV